MRQCICGHPPTDPHERQALRHELSNDSPHESTLTKMSIHNCPGDMAGIASGELGQWNYVNRHWAPAYYDQSQKGFLSSSNSSLNSNNNGANDDTLVFHSKAAVKSSVPITPGAPYLNGTSYQMPCQNSGLGVSFVPTDAAHQTTDCYDGKVELLRRRSLSDTPGYLGRPQVPVTANQQRPPLLRLNSGGSVSRLSAHKLSLSSAYEPTPANISTKKLSTPMLIKKQLKSITEGISLGKTKSKLSKSNLQKFEKSSSEPNSLDGCSADSDFSDDDEYGFQSCPSYQLKDGQNLKNSGSSKAIQYRSTPALVGKDVSSDSSREDGSQDSEQKPVPKRKSFSVNMMKFWPKKVGEHGEGKSAPSSPEILDKSAWMSKVPTGVLSADGRKSLVTGVPVNIIHLTEVERRALKKIAVDKLQMMNLGCSITIPKNGSKMTMKHFFGLKKNSEVSASEDIFREQKKDRSQIGSKSWVFGIPLGKCIKNDLELGRSGSSVGDGVGSARDGKDNLLDALSLSINSCMPTADEQLQVPYFVRTCCRYIQRHGLRVPGLFRIGGSKCRVVLLKKEFDGGIDVELTDQHNIHDVTSLFKEFFRELPDPLLTRELYPAFLACASIEDSTERLTVLRLLVALLPTENRDTLWTLLSFLNRVAQNASDLTDKHGRQLVGNRMDTANLATVFGPNILHNSKGGKFQVETIESIGHSADIVQVVADMIELYAAIFKVTEELHAEILRVVVEKYPQDAGDQLWQAWNARTRNYADLSSTIHDESHNNISFTTASSASVPGETNRSVTGLRNSPTPSLYVSSTSPRHFNNVQFGSVNSLVVPAENVARFPTPDSYHCRSTTHPDSSTPHTSTPSKVSQVDVRPSNLTVPGSNVTGRTSPVLSSSKKTSTSQNSLLFPSKYGQGYGGETLLENVAKLNDGKGVRHRGDFTLTDGAGVCATTSTDSILDGNASNCADPAGLAPGNWQHQRWRHWEELTKQRSDELQEQQTLV